MRGGHSNCCCCCVRCPLRHVLRAATATLAPCRVLQPLGCPLLLLLLLPATGTRLRKRNHGLMSLHPLHTLLLQAAREAAEAEARAKAEARAAERAVREAEKEVEAKRRAAEKAAAKEAARAEREAAKAAAKAKAKDDGKEDREKAKAARAEAAAAAKAAVKAAKPQQRKRSGAQGRGYGCAGQRVWGEQQGMVGCSAEG